MKNPHISTLQCKIQRSQATDFTSLPNRGSIEGYVKQKEKLEKLENYDPHQQEKESKQGEQMLHDVNVVNNHETSLPQRRMPVPETKVSERNHQIQTDIFMKSSL